MKMMLTNPCRLLLLVVVAAAVLSGCTAAHYRKSADKEVYRIIGKKESQVLGKTNQLSIDTRYSSRDPNEIKSDEIVQDRLKVEKLKPSLSDALKVAIENSRAYQFRKEALYLSALTLTRDRYDFQPQFFGNLTAQRSRTASGEDRKSVV